MQTMALSTRSIVLPLLFTTLLILGVSAQTTATTTATATATSASLYPAPTGWSYYGCYNETTGINGTAGQRALNGGVTEAADSMTVPMCLNYCQSNSYSFAGIEYTRECYCAQYISVLSTKISETNCDLPCEGDSSQICGGSLALTVYQTAKSSTKGAGVKVASKAPVGSILALGIAMGMLFCLA